MPRVGPVGHLVRRFTGSLSSRPPEPADEQWALAMLLPGESELWQRLSAADRRHSIRVARDTVTQLAPGPVDRAVAAGALLHDIGKLDAGLGVMGRVGATLWRAVRGEAAARGPGRWARYHRHEAIGAETCRTAGSAAVTIALVARSADAPARALAALESADDSI